MLDLRMLKSEHQQRVEQFMISARQFVPKEPTTPSQEVRLLRARLILEEALETIEALGVAVNALSSDDGITLRFEDLEFFPCGQFDMVETIDGCCDISVVTVGTLSACGVPDKPFQELVDLNNLAKFEPGHSWNEHGKLVKPPGHKAPDIHGKLIEIQRSC